MKSPERDNQPVKKRYSKPEVKQIDLRPEEAVLGNCKTSGTAGPGTFGSCSQVAPCSSLGS